MPYDQTPPGWERNRISDSIIDHIGCTPLVRLNKVAHGLECEVLVKCEFMNAGGSVKDRIGKRMIEDAEKEGRLKKGDTIIEPTSGNTGIGLAITALCKGYRVIITLPEKMSTEKMNMLKALGAEIIRTPTEAAFDSPDSHIGVAARLQKEIPNSHILDQYKNPSNPLAHYDGTAEEILYQCDGKLDMIVCGAGTGGTISGIARKLKEKLPNIEVIGVDPIGSILAQPESLNAEGPSYLVEGIGYDFIPQVLDRSLIDRWIKTEDEASFKMSRQLIREEGLLCGGSCGSAMVGALEAAKSLKKGQRCVVVLPDATRNYMTKFLEDEWMVSSGFEPASILAKGSALSSGNTDWWASKTAVVLSLPTPLTVDPSLKCATAIKVMKEFGFDQLPVVDKSLGVVGVITMATLITKLTISPPSDTPVADRPVSDFMFKQFRQVPVNMPLADLFRIFQRDAYCLIVTSERRLDNDQMNIIENKIVVGVCTQIDILHFVTTNGSPVSPVISDDMGVMVSDKMNLTDSYMQTTENK